MTSRWLLVVIAIAGAVILVGAPTRSTTDAQSPGAVVDGQTRGDVGVLFADNGGDVNRVLENLSEFTACVAGPAVSVDPECQRFDFDASGYVDLADFRILQVGGARLFPPTPTPNIWQIREALPAPVMAHDPQAPVVDVAAEAALTPPVPGDLEPTIDVQITQEIIDKATELGTVEAMYEFVRNECAFQAYYGSQKGSVETLRQRAGNDYDLASLLIALLRASGIPARYAVGMVDMPVDRATSWLAVEDGRVAGSILLTNGMEGMSIWSGTPDNVIAVQARRVWVEAYVPRGYGSPAWVPLDPAFVQTSVHAGLDIPEEMGLDAQAFVEEYYDPSDPSVTLPRVETVLELLKQEITDYVDVNYPGMTLADVMRTHEITPEDLGVLPASLPYTVRSRDTEFSEIPANRRYQIRFHLYDGGTNFIDHTVDLPTVASKRITISYEGATPADQAIIDSYNGLLYTPPNLIDVRPLLKVGGQIVASGAVGVDAGITHNSDMHFLAPVNAAGLPVNVVPAVNNVIIAGAYQAIGLAVHGVTNALLAPADPADEEGFLAQLRYATAIGYLERCIVADDGVGALLHVKVGRDVDDAIVEDQIVVTTDYWGDPESWEWRGLTVDADRKIIGAWKVDELQLGCGGDGKEVMILGGAEGSLYESLVFEDSFYHEAVSTIKILELAADDGITIYKRWSSTTLPANTLPTYVRNAIISAISGGHEVTFPASQITHYAWTGVGYIDMDPCSGAAGYIIAGGQNGGSTVDSWTNIVDIEEDLKFDDIEGKVIKPPVDSPDHQHALFCKTDTSAFDLHYQLRVHYEADPSANPPQPASTGPWLPESPPHPTGYYKYPGQLSPSSVPAGHYYLIVGDHGPDHTRKLTVIEVKMDHDLWWFNGENPGGGYHIETTLTADGVTTETFKWDVTAGAAKVDLNNGGGDSDSITATNDNTVTIKSTAPSAGATNVTKDVTVRLTYNGFAVCDFDTVVFAPDHLTHIGNSHSAYANGYWSKISYEIRDQFDTVLPHDVSWNEDIDANGAYSNGATVNAAATSDWAGEQWSWGDECGWVVSPNSATDNLRRAGALNPTPQNPQTPLGSSKIDHSPQGSWYIGSTTIGEGVKVIDVVWQMYRDHGRHQ